MNTTALTDQIDAANREARVTVATALGLPAGHRPDRGSSPFLDELLDVHSRPETPRCSHLVARPVQVWVMTLPFPGWRCRPCAAAFATAQKARGPLGHVEEHSCDRCRRYLPGETLTPAVLRQDLWIVIGSLCDGCTRVGRRHGVRVLNAPGAAA